MNPRRNSPWGFTSQFPTVFRSCVRYLIPLGRRVSFALLRISPSIISWALWPSLYIPLRDSSLHSLIIYHTSPTLPLLLFLRKPAFQDVIYSSEMSVYSHPLKLSIFILGNAMHPVTESVNQRCTFLRTFIVSRLPPQLFFVFKDRDVPPVDWSGFLLSGTAQEVCCYDLEKRALEKLASIQEENTASTLFLYLL